MKNYPAFWGFISIMLLFFSMYTYVPIFPTYINSMTNNAFMVGIIVGSYGITQMVLRIPLGYLSDITGRRKIFVIIAMLFSVASSGIVVFHQSPTILLICRIFAGVTAAGWVPISTLFTSYYNKESTYKAVGLANSANQLGQSMAIITGGIIAQLFSNVYSFGLATVAAILGLLISFFLYEEPKPDKNIRNPIKSIVETVKNKDIMLPSIIAMFLQFIAFATAFAFTPIFAQEAFYTNTIQISLLSLIYIIPAVFSSSISNFWVRKYSYKTVVFLGFLITSLLTVFIPFAPSFFVLLLIQGVLGFMRGLVMSTLMGRVSFVSRKGIAMGVFQSIYALGMFIGPLISGIVVNWTGNLVSVFLVSAFMGFITILFVFKKKKHSQ